MCLNKEGAVRNALLQAVARPLLSNLLRDFNNEKFHEVKSTSKLLTRAESTVGSALVTQVMRCLCFRLVPAAAAADDVEAPSSTASLSGTWTFGSTPHLTADERRSELRRAEAWLSRFEDAVLGQELVARRGSALDGSRVVEPSLKSSTGTRGEDEDDPHDAFLSQGEKRRQQQQAERQEEVRRIHARHLAEARERAAAESNELAERAALHGGLAQDKQEVAHLVATARSTLHNTGRLRNASFEAKHFQLRSMRHGRSFACTSCPPDAIEAHWHVINGSLLYAYCVHLSADASKVLHLGYEHAYQYNTIPGTEHFGRTVWMTTKHIDDTTGQIALLQHHTKPVDRCVYCNEEFRLLFL
jgi:hypothetical protein